MIDAFKSHRKSHCRYVFILCVIFSENRFPLFRIMI